MRSDWSRYDSPSSPMQSPQPPLRRMAHSLRETVFPYTAFNSNINIECHTIRFSDGSSVVEHHHPQVNLPFIEQQNFDESIVVSPYVAWLILFYSTFNTAMIPCWLMGSISSEPFTRNSWRYFMLAALAFPFMMFEERMLKTHSPEKTFLKNFTWDNMKRIYKRSLHSMVWLLLYILACNYTSLNHACHLTNLMTFFLSVLRVFSEGKNHEYEKGGAGLILFGISLIFFDSLSMPYLEHPPRDQLFLGVHPLLRLFGDFLAILASYLFAYLNETVPVATFEPFGRFFISTVVNYINLVTFGYFFGASEFTSNPLTGLFGLFTINNFVMVFYVSIMLGIGLMLSNILVNQMFSQTIRAMAGIFEPLVTSILYHVIGLEPIPSGLTCIGFSFIVPGQLMIVAGQSIIHERPGLINFRLDH